ncbi:hypothetical protein [Nocardia lijiangensis]|uniref:hypothetical protein n=1 Tax=Nocardia lijiangensis TaxID=299618 RepID=UPI000B315F33|nr:hypothetical protein [Nocardia lijiangensis]
MGMADDARELRRAEAERAAGRRRGLAENLAAVTALIDARIPDFISAVAELGIGAEGTLFDRYWLVELPLATSMPVVLKVRKNGAWQFVRYVYDHLARIDIPTVDREPVFTATPTETEFDAAFARWLADHLPR